MRTRYAYEEQLVSGETVVGGIEDPVVAHQSLEPKSVLFFMSIDPAEADCQRADNNWSNVLT